MLVPDAGNDAVDDSPPPNPDEGRTVALVVPLVVAASLLLWGLDDRGLLVHDEGAFMLGANTIVEGVRGLLAGTPIAELRDTLHRGGGSLYFSGKPGHVFLLALMGLATGGLSTLKGLLVSVLAMLGSTTLVVLIARRLTGWQPATLAGILFACSPLAVEFGRSALGIATATFFLLAATALVLERPIWRPGSMLAGALVFAAFTCHYSVLPVAAALVVGLWGMVDARARWLMAAGFGVAFLAVEGSMQVAAAVLRDAFPGFRTLVGEVLDAFVRYHLRPEALPEGFKAIDGVRGFGWEAWAELARILSGGMAGTLLLGGVGAWSIWRGAADPAGRTERRLVLVWALAPLAFWCLYPWKVERAFATCLPALAVAASCAVAMLFRAHPVEGRAGHLLMAAAGLACAANGFAVLDRIDRKSPLLDFVRTNEEVIAALPEGTLTVRSFHRTTAPIWKWYLGPDRRRQGVPMGSINFADLGPRPGVIIRDGSRPGNDPAFAELLSSGNYSRLLARDESTPAMGAISLYGRPDALGGFR